MAWTVYGTGQGQPITQPVLMSDNNMWSAGGAGGPGTGAVTVVVMTPTGAVTLLGFSLGSEGYAGNTPFCTDGVNAYLGSTSQFPRARWIYWTVATQAFGPVTVVTGSTQLGAVVAGTYGVTTGQNSAATAGAAYNMTLPSTFGAIASIGAAPSLGQCVFDGSWVWSPQYSTSLIWRIHPATLAATSFTLPAANQTGNQYQIGFDGRYVYISAVGGGICVWDVTTNTGVKFGTLVTTHCYYSAHLGAVLTVDGSQNVYTMAPGGGPLALLGNATTNIGASVTVAGFGDGLQSSGAVWLTATGAANNYMAIIASKTSMQWVGMV